MLKGIRVIDFSRFLPGPFASQRLADLGAEVIKVESPGAGDPTRTKGGGAVFQAVNRNKKGVTLNLREPKGKELAFRLACTADVIIESFRPGVASAMGIGFEELKKGKPDLIYCSLTGYGQSGPLSKFGSHDLNYLALSGLLSQLKDGTGRPILPSFQFGDLISGIAASEAILAALVQRSQTKQGSYLDVAATDTLIGMMTIHSAIQSLAGTGQGINELTGSIISYNIYETADGRYVSIAAVERKFWECFCQAIGREEWLPDIFSLADTKNSTFKDMATLFKSKNFAEWVKLSQEVDCCLTPVLETEEMLRFNYVEKKGIAKDSEVNNGMILRQVATSAGGFSPESPGPRGYEGPTLGQHNKEIYSDLLGATKDQIQEWQERGII